MSRFAQKRTCVRLILDRVELMFILFLRYIKAVRVAQLKSATKRVSTAVSKSDIPTSPLKTST